MERLATLKDLLGALARSYIFLALLAAVLAYLTFNALVPQPQVGVIKIEGSIMDAAKADRIAQMLEYARGEPSIRAVVLEIDSPGGLASASEDLYLDVLRLRREKPVVASITTIGASGAYYIAIAANSIYAKPTSIVGSVGVVTTLPSPQKLDENALTTGPFKAIGSSRRSWTYQTQAAAESFQGAVLAQRGERLKIPKEELATAQVYNGIDALRIGLIDGMGSNSDAVEKAADLAGIARYGVVDVKKALNLTDFGVIFFVSEEQLHAPSNTAPINYYLYLEQR